MVIICAVSDCFVYATHGYKLYKIPSYKRGSDSNLLNLAELRTAKWMSACKLRAPPAKHHRICSRHFVSGKPAGLKETDHVDWVPSLNLPYDENISTEANKEQSATINTSNNPSTFGEQADSQDGHVSFDKSNDVNITVSSGYVSYNLTDESGMSINDVSEDTESPVKRRRAGNITDHIQFETSTSAFTTTYEIQRYPPGLIPDKFPSTSDSINLSTSDQGNLDRYQQQVFQSDVCVQTEMCAEKEIQKLEMKLSKYEKDLQQKNRNENRLQIQLSAARNENRPSISCLENDDKKARYFTGLSGGVIVRSLFEAIKQDLPEYSELTKEQVFLLTLRKLRLNEPFCTLGYTFKLYQSTISECFYECINAMYPFMRSLVKFPSRNVLKQHMPQSFRKKYQDSVSVIIDCYEMYMENPNASAMVANANVFSNYKKHKTVKVLVGISPSGSIIFTSEGFGGRASDKEIVKKSGILDLLQDGDFILADRGFLIEDLLAPVNATVSYPAFKKKKNHQLEPMDAVHSRELSSLRIHVERLIGVLRQKFLILSDTIPISLLQRWNNDSPAIDQIILIACALVNLCPSVVNN